MQDGVAELFHEVADLSPAARAHYFVEHQVDAEIQKAAEELLSFDSRESGPLPRVVGLVAEQALLSQLDAAGRRCGPYRLMSVIGHGGMGVVYLAERVDGELTQRVAVKLLQPGVRYTQLDRFLQERQILAGLAHPNIARLLDAGHLEDGQPFLAMEYVDGKPIDVFTADFDVRQKVKLFLKVCSAVAYLHRNLIIHRDLKPGNIIVTANREPKLLDFGIAKILDQADATVTSMRMLTPAYASPEQVVGGLVSTASDIYSLGAVLYELLTGKSPHGHDGGSPTSPGLREPVRPSSWAPALKGDLDYILVKALRSEPRERYATVEQFAEDLEAFLGSRPVRARSGDAWYRTRKFLRRRRLPVAAAMLTTASLFTGLYVANRERAVAQQRSVQVRKLAGHLIFDLHDEIRKVPGATQAREKLVSVATDYLSALSQEAESDPELAWELMNAYYRLSQTRGGVGANLGRTEEAYRLSRDVVKIAGSLEASGPLNSERLGTLFKIYDNTTRMYVDMRRRSEAESAVQQLLKLAPRLAPLHRAEAFSAVSTYEDVFGSPLRSLEHAEAAARILASLPDQYAIRYQYASNLMQLARVQGKLGRFDEAVQTYEASIAASEAALQTDAADQRVRRHLYLAHVWLADLLGSDDRFNLGRVNAAEKQFRAAIGLAERMAASDSKNEAARIDLARAAGKLGSAIYQSRPAEALSLMNRAYALMQQTSAVNDAAAEMKCAYFTESVKPLIRLNRIADAQFNLNAAAAVLEELRVLNPKRDWSSRQLSIYMGQSLIHEARGNWAAALETANRELGLIERSGGPSVLGEDYGRVATLERIVRFASHIDAEAAFAAQRRLVEIWTKWLRELPDSRYVARRLRSAKARLNALATIHRNTLAAGTVTFQE